MNINGIVFTVMYGTALVAPLIAYLLVWHPGPRMRKVSRAIFWASTVFLVLFFLSLNWEFGYARSKYRISCWDGMLGLDVVNESASTLRLKQLGWNPEGWFRKDNSVVRMFLYTFVPIVRTRDDSINSIDLPLACLFFIIAGPSFVAWRRSRKAPPGCCTDCGYDLTGNVSGICPECGAAIETRDLTRGVKSTNARIPGGRRSR